MVTFDDMAQTVTAVGKAMSEFGVTTQDMMEGMANGIAQGKARGMVSREAIDRFYEEAESGGHPMNEPFLMFRDNHDTTWNTKELVLDGTFTLDHLKKIVAAWERLNNDTSA